MKARTCLTVCFVALMMACMVASCNREEVAHNAIDAGLVQKPGTDGTAYWTQP